MAEGRFVHLEGLESPCLLVCADNSMPEEIVVDYAAEDQAELGRRGAIVYRLQPSTAERTHPVYVEIFDE